MKANIKKSNNSPYFVFIGNAYPHKNLDRLIQAFVILNKEMEIILKISSSRNVFTERLVKLIRKNNAEKYIKLLGYVPDDEIDKLYKNSVGLVFPTLSEGFGLPPKEAIMSGTLAFVSDISVLKEVYGDSVFYFDPYNINSIVDTLKKGMQLNSSQRFSKLNYAQKYLKRYSWQKNAEETLKVYESSIR